MPQIMSLGLLPTTKLFMYTNKTLCYSAKWWDDDSEQCSTPQEVILRTCFLFSSLFYNYIFFQGRQCHNVALQSFRLFNTEAKERLLGMDHHNDLEICKTKHTLPFYFCTFVIIYTTSPDWHLYLYSATRCTLWWLQLIRLSLHFCVYKYLFFCSFYRYLVHLPFFFSTSAFLK